MGKIKMKKTTKKTVPRGVAMFKKMLDDKKAIGKDLRTGGTFNEFKEEVYKFATV